MHCKTNHFYIFLNTFLFFRFVFIISFLFNFSFLYFSVFVSISVNEFIIFLLTLISVLFYVNQIATVIQCKNAKFKCSKTSIPQNCKILMQRKFHVLQYGEMQRDSVFEFFTIELQLTMTLRELDGKHLIIFIKGNTMEWKTRL